ncbi:unnamed protein product [Amaranthus hypochondriacus]
MSNLKDGDKSDDIGFSWGIRKGRGGQNKDVQFYGSFTYDDVEYFLYDCVYLLKEGEAKPYVGKLIKIWEAKNKERKVKILWFFHPEEISNYLVGENVLENELFLATGVGKGLANVNPLEAIAGKCNVVCISNDERNRQPSKEELKMADYVFYRTFDVQDRTISDKLGEKIAMIDVNFLLKKNDSQLPDLSMVHSENRYLDLEKEEDKPIRLLDKSIAHPMITYDATGAGKSVAVVGLERKLIKKDLGGADEGEKYKGSEGFSILEEDNGSNERGDATRLDIDPVGFPATEVALAFNQNIMRKNCVMIPTENGHHDSGINNVNDSRINSVDNSVLLAATDNRKSKLKNDNYRSTDAVLNSKTQDRPLKKLKVDGSAPLSSDNGGTSTLKRTTADTQDRPLKKFKVDVTAPLSSDNGGTSTQKDTIVGSHKAFQSVAAANGRDRLTKECNGISNSLSKKLQSEGLTEDESYVKHGKLSVKRSKDMQGSSRVYVAAIKGSLPVDDDAEIVNKVNLSRKMVGASNEKCKVPTKETKDAEIEAFGRVKEVTNRPPDRSKWFTASPWEDRMKEAYDQHKLILLQNLDATYTSSEVEDIVWHAFGESCTAQVVQRTATSNRYSGKALVIFKTRDVAERIISKLDTGCLMLPNERPLIASREICFPGKPGSFPGHLVLDKVRHQQQRESREAVSTSHSAQPNTLEYEMAIEWRLLQAKSELCWKMLYKKQAEETKKLKASLKSK